MSDAPSGDDASSPPAASGAGQEAQGSPASQFQQKLSPAGSRDDEGEHVLWKGRYSPKAMIGTWILTGLVTVVVVIGGTWLLRYLEWSWGSTILLILAIVLVGWAAVGLQLAYRMYSVRYELTNQRFIHKAGILRRTTDRIETIDMDDITSEQTLIQRFVGVGTVRIQSSDRTHPELLLIGIENVEQVAKLVDDCRRKERMRRGVHIESI